MDSRTDTILNSIADDLAASAPGLASRLSIFGRLAAGEPVPLEPGAPAARRRTDTRRQRWRWLLLRAARGWAMPAIVTASVVAPALIIVLVVLLTAGHLAR